MADGLFAVLDPDRRGQYFCDHSPVGGSDVQQDEAGTAETQLCDAHQLPGAGVGIQEVRSSDLLHQQKKPHKI